MACNDPYCYVAIHGVCRVDKANEHAREAVLLSRHELLRDGYGENNGV